MKQSKKLKLLLTILITILIYLISFVGIYGQKQHKMVNMLPEYLLGMEFEKNRYAVAKVDSSVTATTYDAEGNIIKDEDKDENIEYTEENGYKIANVPVNKEEILTEENYNKTKKYIEKRLKDMGVNQYTLKLNKQNGTLIFELPEDEQTDSIIGNVFSQGKFEMIDSEDHTLLMDNSHIKSAQVLYNTDEHGTTVYLSIEFNKEGRIKLEEISQKYVQTAVEIEATEEEETHTHTDAHTHTDTVTKNVTVNIDGQELLTTYFGEKMSNGEISISIGATTTDAGKLQEYIEEASTIATVLTHGNLPIKYNVEHSQLVEANIGNETLKVLIFAFIVIQIIMLLVLIIKLRSKGIVSAIAHIGFIALLLIVIRFTNVILTIEGLSAILVISIINIFGLYKLGIEENKAFIKYTLKLIPLYIISVIWCFSKWLPLASFGMAMFWGFIVQAIYNFMFEKVLK